MSVSVSVSVCTIGRETDWEQEQGAGATRIAELAIVCTRAWGSRGRRGARETTGAAGDGKH